MPWLTRGLADGVVTTRWPRRADDYASGSPAALARVRPAADGAREPDAVAVCPTGAIRDEHGGVRLDGGRCIGCGRCVRAFPELFEPAPGPAQARYVSGEHEATPEEITVLRAGIAARTRRLRRSVHLRHVDAGSDGTEEWEINALFNPVYDIHRLGLFLTASPRHADVLLVTGIGATGMLAPLARTRAGMPDPVVVVAVGTDACSGGVWRGSHAGSDGVAGVLDVDVWVPGSPPTPFAILYGILLALGRFEEAR